jgi:hypothetical protein
MILMIWVSLNFRPCKWLSLLPFPVRFNSIFRSKDKRFNPFNLIDIKRSAMIGNTASLKKTDGKQGQPIEPGS